MAGMVNIAQKVRSHLVLSTDVVLKGTALYLQLQHVQTEPYKRYQKEV